MIVEGFNFELGRVEARRRARQMVGNGLYSRFSLSDGARIEKAELGCIGEVAFEHWLCSQGIAYEVDSAGFENRNSDEFDFRIDGKTVDVKVAKLSTPNPPAGYWRFGVPVEQNPASKDVLVIGWVDFAKEQVGFQGWITGAQVASCPKVTENSLTHARYLTLNHEFRWDALDPNLSGIVR